MATIKHLSSFWTSKLPLYTRFEIFINQFRVETAELTKLTFADAADAERFDSHRHYD